MSASMTATEAPLSSQNSPGRKRHVHAWSHPPLMKLMHFPPMTEVGVEGVLIRVCWKCAKLKAEVILTEEGKKRWGNGEEEHETGGRGTVRQDEG